MLRYFSSIPSFLRDFIPEVVLDFVKDLFCIC
jgi:hypothetical protein